MALVRVSKLLAARGLCSRREAEEYMRRGWVSSDGVVLNTLGTRVEEDQNLTLAAPARQRQAQRVTVLLNKPVGYVSSQPEKGYPPAVSLVTAPNQHARAAMGPPPRAGLAPAGRLDIDSQGLLVLTQDGRIARRLIGPENAVEKEYVVQVRGRIVPAMLERLRHGLALDGRPLAPAQIVQHRPGELRFTLIEGRKRQIRRMCELVGLQVSHLRRVRIGAVRLGRLPLGKWRYLKPDEQF